MEWIQNAYEAGWNDAQEDLFWCCSAATPEELEKFFTFALKDGTFKPHQKEQFLKGYRNSINNGLEKRD